MTALDIRQISEKELKSAAFPAVRQELRIFVAEAAFDRAVKRGDADTTREIGGVLVGELLRDASGPFLRVDATIDALHAEEKGAELTFTHATWEHIHKEMDETYADKKIVGWYHTHPGFGIFLSDRDQFIQTSFFNLPFQIAFVYDPKSKEHGVFAWRDGKPARARRYWVGEREHTWDGARTTAPKDDAPPKSTRKSPAAASPSDEPKEEDTGRGGSWGLRGALSAGLVALFLGAVGGFLYGTREARVALQQMDAEVQRARQEAIRDVVSDIDSQLLGILKTTVGNEAVRRPLDDVIGDLDAAGKTLAVSPGPDDAELAAALERLRDARERAQRLRDDRGDAKAVLGRLEEMSRQGAQSPAEMSRDIGVLRVSLGALYADLAADAAKSGDARKAQRMLAVAASVDPANRARYEQQLKELGGGAIDPAPSVPVPGKAVTP